MPTVFRDFANIVETFGLRMETGQLMIAAGTYVAHATAEDEVVHFAELTIGGRSDLVLFIPCRRLIIDEKADALEHLRRPETAVDCMTCLVRSPGR